jgi:hypothetical protein
MVNVHKSMAQTKTNLWFSLCDRKNNSLVVAFFGSYLGLWAHRLGFGLGQKYSNSEFGKELVPA